MISQRLKPFDKVFPPPLATVCRRGATGIVCRLERTTGHSRGFTLFEVLLVLTILTLVVGLAWPSLSRLFAHHRLRQAANLLSVRMSAGRIRAVETGLIYQFRYEPGGRRFLLVPFDREQVDETSPNAQRAIRIVGKLPASCRFEGGQSFNDKGTAIPDDLLAGIANAADFVGALWSTPTLFHPDGTATDFEVAIVGDKKEQVRLTLRALTGSVTVTPERGG